MRSAAALVLASTMLFACASATAETFVPGHPVAGPALDGSRVWWVEVPAWPTDTDSTAPLQVVFADPGGPPRVRYTTPPAWHQIQDEVQLSASAGRVAVVDGAGSLYLGDAHGLQHVIGEASAANPQGCSVFAAELDGDQLAYLYGSCGGNGSPLVYVRDLDGGGATHVVQPPQFDNFERSQLLLSGRYVAVRLTTGSGPPENLGHYLVVYDWTTGQEVYRVDLVKLVGGDPAYYDIQPALQSDGKLAVAYSAKYGGGSRIAWFSPFDPAPHQLPFPVLAEEARKTHPLAMSHDLIFFRYADQQALGVSDLAGRLVDRIPSHNEPHHPGSLAFDGSHLAWQDIGYFCAGPFPGPPSCRDPVTGLAVTATARAIGMTFSLKRTVRVAVTVDRCTRGIVKRRCRSPRRVAHASRLGYPGRNQLRLTGLRLRHGSYRARVSTRGGAPAQVLFRRG
jgi:hypothetical protein